MDNKLEIQIQEAKKLIEQAKQYFIEKYKLEERAKKIHKNATAKILYVTSSAITVSYSVRDVEITREYIEFGTYIDEAIGKTIESIESTIKKINDTYKSIDYLKKDIERIKNDLKELYNIEDITDIDKVIELEKQKRKEEIKKRIKELEKELKKKEKELEKLQKEYENEKRRFKELLKKFFDKNKIVATKLLNKYCKDENILKKVTKVIIHDKYIDDTIRKIALASVDKEHYYLSDNLFLCAYDENDIEVFHKVIRATDIRNLIIKENDKDAYELVVLAKELEEYDIYEVEGSKDIASKKLDKLLDQIEDINRVIEDLKREIESSKSTLENESFYLRSSDLKGYIEELEEEKNKLQKLSETLNREIETLQALLDM